MCVCACLFLTAEEQWGRLLARNLMESLWPSYKIKSKVFSVSIVFSSLCPRSFIFLLSHSLSSQLQNRSSRGKNKDGSVGFFFFFYFSALPSSSEFWTFFKWHSNGTCGILCVCADLSHDKVWPVEVTGATFLTVMPTCTTKSSLNATHR